MAIVGKKFPSVSIDAMSEMGDDLKINVFEEAVSKEKKVLLFWYPKDFTFVCPTEIKEFNNAYGEFRDRDARLIGASTDTENVHLAWRHSHDDLRDLKFPMLADTSKSLAEELGILEPTEKIAYRATYIVDPTGIIRWVSVNDLNVGRNVREVLRVLDGLQTDALCPCNWEKGQETLTV